LNPSDIPVVVIGQATTALSVQRLVAKIGNPVFAACAPKSWPTRTKHYQPLPETRLGRWHGELGDAGYEHLAALPFERAIIIPTADDAGFWLSNLPGSLRERFLFCGSDTETLEKLQDKAVFSALNRELGVAAPQSFVVNTRAELESLQVDWSADLFIKPRKSQAFQRQTGVKALRFSDKNTALRIWDENNLESLGVLVQEYVPGGADQHYFIDGFRDRKGQFPACLARRRIRMFPQDFGDSSLCKSIGIGDVEPAWQALQFLLQQVGYQGIFSAEFKHDARDGKFKLIEINTRPWVYVQFAEWCGINVCELYIDDACNNDVKECPSPLVDKYCVNLLADMKSIRSLPRGTKPGYFNVLTAWLTSFKVVFDWRDLRPAAIGAIELLSSRARRLYAGRS
jgi:D-aspartate ligase